MNNSTKISKGSNHDYPAIYSADGVYWQHHPVLTAYEILYFTASPTVIWIISVFTFILASFGLCFYIRVCYIISKLKSVHFANPFYTLVLFLAVPDCLFLLTQIIGCFINLIGFFNISIYFTIVVGFFEQVASWALFALISAMGVNRYVSICYPQQYKVYFGVKQARAIGLFCWFLGSVLPTVDYYCKCYIIKSDFAWKFVCDYSRDASRHYVYCWETAIKFDEVVSIIFTTFVPFINVLTFCQYRIRKRMIAIQMNQEVKMEKQDLKILAQFIIISGVFITYTIFYWIQDGQLVYSITFDVILTWVSILNSSVNPYLYAAFNHEIRSQLFGSKSSTVKTVKTVSVHSNASVKTRQDVL